LLFGIGLFAFCGARLGLLGFRFLVSGGGFGFGVCFGRCLLCGGGEFGFDGLASLAKSSRWVCAILLLVETITVALVFFLSRSFRSQSAADMKR